MKNNYVLYIVLVFFLLLSWNAEAKKANIIDSQQGSISSALPIYAADTSDNPSIASRLMKLEFRVDSDMKLLEWRIDSIITAITFISTILGIILTLLAIYGVIRDRKLHKEYQSERAFYESRINKIDNRQEQGFDQQLAIGQSVLSRSSDIISEQIRNITNLGNIIDVVHRTHALQLQREEAQSDLQKKLDETSQIVNSIQADFTQKFVETKNLIFQLKDVKAMEWPKLPEELKNIAIRARSKFEDIPSHILHSAENKDAYDYAHMLLLLGTSAYYDNDIAFAIEHIKKADDIYKNQTSRPEDDKLRAYTKHFLAIIEKNWQLVGSAVGSNLDSAAQLLTEAYGIVKNEKSQFLIPVTLAEVYSYQYLHNKETQENASEFIEMLLDRFKNAGNIENMNENQRILYARTYLLNANIDFIKGNFINSKNSCEKACDLNPSNPYAHLSLAHALFSAKEEHIDCWTIGLNLLEQSGAVLKRELSTRVVAFAWGFVASHYAGNQESEWRYRKSIETVKDAVRQINYRRPLFFSPLSRSMVDFLELETALFQL
jgi:hypothetical protein